ncbi:tumor necrosis factor receptor superfamily member 1B isoform X2 [Micropterus dolomieu]|uniref:tumor necrosis factor receptor superfamily member 1B isoform X2 n=1 Tax=Micropterus dolomieu TaxID=147949 RepID=UPI001E8CDB32|nr:tumor necrosis factor receptor superfamily member 1B isoform X2 [Micropterus dolomieu]
MHVFNAQSLKILKGPTEKRDTAKVCSQPYEPDSNGTCRDRTTEYLSDESNRCCKKCHPGQRQKDKCTETTETVCEQCPAGQYMESFNYSPTCFACDKCKPNKGLQPGQKCSSTTKSKCVCQPGMYCVMGFDDPYCTECNKYKTCKVGFGVSQPGTANSDVKCKRCPDGTFSDKASDTDPCQPHTNCSRSGVVRKGNATSDNVCAKPNDLATEKLFKTASTTTNTVLATSDSKAPHGPTNPTLSISHLPSAVSEAVLNHSTKSLPTSPGFDSILAAAIPTIIGSILLFIIIILLCLCKPMCKKDAENYYPSVDANGNVESSDKINQGYLGKTQLDSFTVMSPEQQCLLEKGEAYSDQSQSSNNTETLTRTNGCSSFESIDPLQSTIPLYNPCSALSQPMALLSNVEPVTPQPSVQTQSSSQPTSPQIISPVTTSPHVNVNITFHIGNGTCGTPSVLPTDLMQGESKLPFGEEEESFSIPQQEAGKQSLMSVQEESASYSA